MKISKKIVGFNVNTSDTSDKGVSDIPDKGVSDSGVSDKKESATDSAKAAPVKADVIQMHETLQRPEKLIGSTYKLKVPDHVSSHAMYITINDVILNEGTEHELRRPFEVFINSKNLEHYQWIVALTLIMSATFRKGGDITFLVEELKSVFDPRGGYWNKGKYMPSIIAELGNVIEQHLIDIGMLQAPELDPHQKQLIEEKKAELKPTVSKTTESTQNTSNDSSASSSDGQEAWQANASHCNKCNHKAVMVRDGCATCLNCGDSKCG
ncbi:MAG: NrdJb [Gammaproteobacteria bacterium]|nr:NrdJb [Gammaproteobacteria bacterium]